MMTELTTIDLVLALLGLSVALICWIGVTRLNQTADLAAARAEKTTMTSAARAIRAQAKTSS